MLVFLLRLLRIIGLIVNNILFFIIFVPALLILKTLKIHYSKALLKSVRLWSVSNCLIMGIRVKIKGRYLERGGRFIPCNHLSYTDVPVIASIIPCVFVAKEEVKRWPLFGILSSTAETIFVNRSSKKSTYMAIKYAEKVLSQGTNIVVFPEATTSDGLTIKKFNSAFFFLPERLEIDVQPVVISYLDQNKKPFTHEAAWYGDMNIFSHLWKITGLKRMYAVVYFCDMIKNKPENRLTRKDLAILCETAIKEKFHKITK
ncbi:MAG: lysophospholipid acyltransferase family protein [Thermodesulfovibrionales bacterium]